MNKVNIQDNYVRKATVCHIVDGDTIDVIFDLGFDITSKQRIRFEVVNTPEKGQEGYQEAKDYVTEQLLGKEVLIQTVKYKSAGWGRYLGYVYVPNEDGSYTNLGDALLELELAVPYQKG